MLKWVKLYLVPTEANPRLGKLRTYLQELGIDYLNKSPKKSARIKINPATLEQRRVLVWQTWLSLMSEE